MRTRRGRIACWSLSAILVGVLVLAGARWGDFLCQYHLARLRRDPAYVDALLGSDEGTPARRALTLHAGTPDGFLALSRLWADAVLEAMVPASGRNRSLTLLSDLPPGLALLGIHGGSGNRGIYFKSASGLGSDVRIEGLPTASRLSALDAGWTEACMVGALAAFEGLGKASLPYMEEARSRCTGPAQQRLEEARVGILYGSAPKYWVEADADGERTSLEAPQPPLESPDGP